MNIAFFCLRERVVCLNEGKMNLVSLFENGIDNIRFNATYLSVVENFLVYKMVVQDKLRLCSSYLTN
ncbi:hypothetical protein GOY14_02505 [Wolbachia endosymbiont of Dipetalonema caudispina]|uniref:hypothetical protein n=1 Tax=Wolbachia endosymbiont of Dipetalonema caudispina TaxID=1812112 RepID=UPI00159AB917|nr:hypothetical protein [Wolbachia endosymbiont of Dipetalonema caudispina]QKX01190.1 hypothetical protein GOY14_02505 [Wolbachia endosymbiont of Dipetalonema caudispina]